MNIDSKNLFDTLILIIGTNPLPNFVISEYFILENPNLKNIIHVYSEQTRTQRGTLHYADNLINLIQRRHENRKLEFKKISLSDISSATEIKGDLDEILTKELNHSSSVHLNYTGGTKVMGIHLYRWIENFAEEKKISASFSYLDARTFRLVYDDGKQISCDLRNKIHLTLDELIYLHGFERTNKDNEEKEIFSCAISKFSQIIEKGKLTDFFRTYKRKYFTDENRSLIKKVNKLTENISKLKSEGNIEIKAEGEFLEVIKAMPEEYRFFNDEGLFIEPKSNHTLKKTIEFIDGKWLEIYVCSVLSKTMPSNEIKLYQNWEIKNRERNS